MGAFALTGYKYVWPFLYADVTFAVPKSSFLSLLINCKMIVMIVALLLTCIFSVICVIWFNNLVWVDTFKLFFQSVCL